MGLNPLKSGPTFGLRSWLMREYQPKRLNPLKSGPTFGCPSSYWLNIGEKSLNPLKSGPTFGFLMVRMGNKQPARSQSPQIGSYLRFESPKTGKSSHKEVSIPSNRVLPSVSSIESY